MAKKLVVVSMAILFVAAACSDAGTERDTAEADRTVPIEMLDNRFVPGRVNVRRGETIAFRFTNEGKVPHDAFIGDEEAQEEHEMEMREADEGHGGHGSSDESAVTVQPGEEATLVYTFSSDAEVEIGCHQPGHYADGMIADVMVR